MKSMLKLQGLAEDVPGQLSQILADLEGGKFRVHVRSESLDRIADNVRSLGLTVFLGLLASALALGGLFVVSRQMVGSQAMLLLGFAALLLAGFLFGASLTVYWLGGASPSCRSGSSSGEVPGRADRRARAPRPPRGATARPRLRRAHQRGEEQFRNEEERRRPAPHRPARRGDEGLDRPRRERVATPPRGGPRRKPPAGRRGSEPPAASARPVDSPPTPRGPRRPRRAPRGTRRGRRRSRAPWRPRTPPRPRADPLDAGPDGHRAEEGSDHEPPQEVEQHRGDRHREQAAEPPGRPGREDRPAPRPPERRQPRIGIGPRDPGDAQGAPEEQAGEPEAEGDGDRARGDVQNGRAWRDRVHPAP